MLALSVLLLAFFFAPPEWCTLSGTVVDSVTGAPLSKVGLRAELTGADPGASTTTDAHGNFTLVDLPAGQFRLKGVRNGYLDTYYGARRSGSAGMTITLEPGQEMRNLVVKLLPFGVIAGTVRDADGEPLSGATITLLRQRYDRPGHVKVEPYVQDVNTDDLGRYRIANLESGKYYVEADPRDDLQSIDHSAKSAEPRTVLVPALYPGVTDLSAARVVDVGSGARLAGIDISLVRRRVFNVSGHVSTASGTEVGLWLYSLFYPGDSVGNIGLSFGTETKAGNGDFDFRGVPQGSYTLRARGDVQIPLTVEDDVQDVRIAISDGTQVSGYVTVEGGDKTKLAGLRIHFSNGDRAPEPKIGEDDHFSADLYPDRYHIYLDMPSLIIKSIRSEQTDVFLDGLTVSPGAKTSLEIVLAPEGAQVDGVVSDRDQKLVAGATVVLIAEPKLRSCSDSFHEYSTDQYGRYHFENIRAGDYKLFAWDDPEPNAWYDPEFLKPFEEKGERIVIQPKGHVVSNLHVIPPAR